MEFFILLKVQGDADFLFSYCGIAVGSQRGYVLFGSISLENNCDTHVLGFRLSASKSSCQTGLLLHNLNLLTAVLVAFEKRG